MAAEDNLLGPNIAPACCFIAGSGASYCQSEPRDTWKCASDWILDAGGWIAGTGDSMAGDGTTREVEVVDKVVFMKEEETFEVPSEAS